MSDFPFFFHIKFLFSPTSHNTNLANTDEQVSALNRNMEWKFLGSVTGNKFINLPNDYNELLVEVSRGTSTVRFVWHLCKELLTDTELVYKEGSYASTTIYESVAIIGNKTRVGLYAINDGVNDITSSSTMKVYYR